MELERLIEQQRVQSQGNDKPAAEKRTSPYVHTAREQLLKIRNFERNGRIYEALGIRIWTNYYPNGGSRVPLTGRLYSQGTGNRKEKLENFIQTTKKLELVHWMLLPFFTGLMIATRDEYLDFATATAANILINIYPIMSQRYNRTRAEGLLTKRS